MKFVFTGAGGGHFYPLIAVAEAVRAEVYIQSLPDPELIFLSDDTYDKEALESVRMRYSHVPAGKLRLYFSIENFTDIFKTGWGIIVAFFKISKSSSVNISKWSTVKALFFAAIAIPPIELNWLT